MKIVQALAAALSLSFASSAFAYECVPTVNRNAFSGEAFIDTPATFTDMPDTVIQKPASEPGCAMVHFSVTFKAGTGNGMRVRILVNNSVLNLPKSVDLYPTAGKFEQRTAQFIIPNLPAAARTIKVQYHSINGSLLQVKDRLTTIYYNGTPTP